MHLPAMANGDAAAAQVHLRAASESYQAGDYEGFTESLEAALKLNPHSIHTRYGLARGYARTGRHTESLQMLHELVELRIDPGMAEDEDLASLRGDPRFAQLLAVLEQKLEPVRKSRHRYTIEQLGLIPEGITIDAATNRMFLSSMRSGAIYVLDEFDRLSVFATVEHDGPLAAIGLEADADRGILWAIGAAFDTVAGFDADAPMRTGVFGFDLATGELRRKHIGDERFAGFNDVSVAPSGDVYLSGGGLAVVRNGSDAIEPLATSFPIFGANGISVDPSGSRLFVSSYPVGIAVIDLRTGQANWLQSPDDATLYGIDGLYWHRGDLIGVQNGVDPWRLIRLHLDDGMESVARVEFIEFANDKINPTTGAIVGDVIHYVGQGPPPDPVPAHVPAYLAQWYGKTIVFTAPLN